RRTRRAVSAEGDARVLRALRRTEGARRHRRRGSPVRRQSRRGRRRRRGSLGGLVMNDAVIVSAARTAVGKAPAGALRGTRPAERVMCGFATTIVAGGTESMSLVPMGGHKLSPNPTLMDVYPDVYLSTGLVAENHARESNISRDEQDAFALRSHQRAIAAIDSGRFADEIVPVAAAFVDGANRDASSRLQPDATGSPNAPPILKIAF